jgi:hypothetical protein
MLMDMLMDILIDRKKHFRLLSQPPFSFLFCAKTKNCADKKIRLRMT